MSDAESDSYSLLEAPRPRVQDMLKRALIDGSLTEQVLGRAVDLSRAIAFSLEVLGLGISTPEEQAAAGKTLQQLCTHVKLRPAVDNLLVLRRLYRVVELTDSAAALSAAVEALFAIADDAAWQTKGCCSAESVHDALVRCVGVLSKAARELNAASTQPQSGASSSVSSADPTDSHELFALAAAAASVLKPAVLPVLEADEVQEAARALGSCVAAGITEPAVLAALAAVLRGDSAGADRVAAATAAIDAGAVPALVRLLEAPSLPQLLKSDASDASKDDQPSSDPGEASTASVQAAQLSAPAASAFSALKDLLLVTSSAGAAAAKTAAVQALQAGALASLVPLLGLPSKTDAAATLRVLLVLVSSSSKSRRKAAVESLVELLSTDPSEVVDPALAAADALLSEPAASQGGSISAKDRDVLLQVVAALLVKGVVTPKQLELQAPGVVELAEESVIALGSGSVPQAAAGASAVTVLGAILACGGGSGGEGESTQSYADAVSPFAAALVDCAVNKPGNFLDLGTPGIRCLTQCLQLAAPEGVWQAEHVKPFASLLRAQLAAPGCTANTLQLASIALTSKFQTINKSDEGLAELLILAEIVLQRTVAFTTSTDPAGHSPAAATEHLALAAGALNAVIAALSPQHALTGAASQSLLPRLPGGMLTGKTGRSSSQLISLRPVLKPSAAYNIPPSASVQLQWAFEGPKSGSSVAETFQWFTEYNLRQRGFSSYGYSSSQAQLAPVQPTIAATTAKPLLEAFVAASNHVSYLVGEVVGDIAEGGHTEAARVVQAAVKVAANAAAVLAACIPPATTELA